MVDLRQHFDRQAKVIDGVLYQRGLVVQVWWYGKTSETWRHPNSEEAIQNFHDMEERFNDDENEE